MPRNLTAVELAKILSAELDEWGDIAPVWFTEIAEQDDPEDRSSESKELEAVLERVVQRIKKMI